MTLMHMDSFEGTGQIQRTIVAEDLTGLDQASGVSGSTARTPTSARA